jgi:hypothetical protein
MDFDTGEYPSEEAALSDYNNALGQFMSAWNSLQEVLCTLFVGLLATPTFDMAQAIWHSITNDRTQREFIQVILEKGEGEHREGGPFSFPESLKAEIKWLLLETDKIANVRNEAAHAPIMMGTYDDDTASLLAYYSSGNTRAVSLDNRAPNGKAMSALFRKYAARAKALTEFSEKLA